MKMRHQAVSSIIATLLMVATGVTGGTTVFVMMPYYIDNNDLERQDEADQFTIIGYSARDHSGIIDDHLKSTLTCVGATDSGDLTDGDCITVFIENKGAKHSLIQDVIVFDKVYSFDSTGASASTCQTTSGSYSVHTNGNMAQAVEGGAQASICIKYSDKTLNIGKSIPVQIESFHGQDLELKINNGDMRE